MRRIAAEQDILAIVYSQSDAAAAVLRRLSEMLRAASVACAGYIELVEPVRPGRSRCDIVIRNLATGERLLMSEDRGPHARGCRLDTNALAAAIESARTALKAAPEVLLVNKFGKTEGEGGGFRPLIADALEAGIPVVVAVPWRNIDSWRAFVGDLAREVPVDELVAASDDGLLQAAGFALTGDGAANARSEPQTRPQVDVRDERR